MNISKLTIKEVQAKSILTTSKLPAADFVVNPYIGCEHGCKYCYAKFMRRFTNHDCDNWGSFVDVKTNAVALIPDKPSKKYFGKHINFGSVTDTYQPLEARYKLTRGILLKLLAWQPSISIITKSNLILRDLDLLKQFRDIKVIMSLALLDDKVRCLLEPKASSVRARLVALEKLHAAGLRTVLFISPILPFLTPWRELILQAKDLVDEVWFENFNFYGYLRADFYAALRAIDSKLIPHYNQIYSTFKCSDYWPKEAEQIREFCLQHVINHAIYFHK